jgi:hypothetical protein
VIKSNFKSCREILQEILLIFFVKTQHFSKETGRLEKILQFQMQFAQLGRAWGRLDFFSVKVHDQGDLIRHIGVVGSCVL